MGAKKHKEEPIPEQQNETVEQPEAENTEPVEAVVEDAPKEQTPDELLAAEKEKFLRLAAEYDNFRKRSIKERESLYRTAKSDTVTKLLPVYDNMLRALETPCSDEAYFKGVEMTTTQLTEILKALGVEEIPAVGEPFDPERHNAVSQVSVEDTDSGVITAEFQKGFMIDGKVIRHSMVQVNS